MNENSNAERQKRYREKQKALRMGSVTGEEVTESVTAGMTPTDKLFEELKIRYYIYAIQIRTAKCEECGKDYTTRMELNKFCSPTCQAKYIRNLVTLR